MLKLTIQNDFHNVVTIEVQKQQHVIYPAACPDSIFLCAKPWNIEGLDVTLHVAIGTNGNIKYVWSFDRKRANNYLHLDEDYAEYNQKVAVTDKMMETIEGLFSGRIKIDGLRISVGATAQLRRLNLEEEEKRCGQSIYLA
jgi:hypothetical protein